MESFDKKTNNGRSMLEVLAVLGIVGILSLGVFAGFKMAMDKHKANELYDELQRSILNISSRSDVLEMAPGQEIALKGANDTSFGITARRIVKEDDSEAVAEVEITGINKRTCVELLKRPVDTPYIIKVGNRDFNPKYPDYSVCDIFDDAKLDLFVSSAYAKVEYNKSIIYTLKYIPKQSEIGLPLLSILSACSSSSGVDDCKKVLDACKTSVDSKLIYTCRDAVNGGNQKDIHSACREVVNQCENAVNICSKKGGEWSGSSCCDGGIARYTRTVAGLNAGELCCTGGRKKVVANPDRDIINGEPEKSACCKEGDEAYIDQYGRAVCCDDGLVVNVIGGVSGEKMCCGRPKDGKVSVTAYRQSAEGSPLCCEGSVDRVNDVPYCCSSGKKIPVVGGSGDFCCEEGSPYLTKNGPQCCEGRPYEYKTVYVTDPKPAGAYCCEDGLEVMSIAGFEDKDGYKGCCKPGQKAYFDANAKTQKCCDNEPVNKNGVWTCDGCSNGEVETAVLGKKSSICCSTETYGKTPKAFYDGSKSACCAGEIYPTYFSVARTWGALYGSGKRNREEYNYNNPTKYACCSGEGMELVDVKYLYHDGLKHCCKKGQTAYLNTDLKDTPACCDGDVIRTIDGYECCPAGTHAVESSGGTTYGIQRCCPLDSNSVTYDGQCCPAGTTVFDCGGQDKCLITDLNQICSGHTYGWLPDDTVCRPGLKYCRRPARTGSGSPHLSAHSIRPYHRLPMPASAP